MRLKLLLPFFIAALLGQACLELPEVETTTPSGSDADAGTTPQKHPPEVTEVRQTASSVPGGGTITLHFAARDPRDGALSFSWEASAGALGKQTDTTNSSEVSWTAPGCGSSPSETATTITATVTSAPGISISRSFSVKGTCYSPEIVGTQQSATSVSDGAAVTLHLTARDPQNSALSFSWHSDAGSFGAPENNATFSEIVWTAPPCGSSSPKEFTARLTGIATNALGRSTPASFNITATCPKWSPTSAMRSARLGHTATLLLSGKVLVTGGYQGSSRYSSAEVYDPTTNIWFPTGSMASARHAHTATLLPSGKLLVTGGMDDTTRHSTAEVYDPAGGTWSSTGNMAHARYRHTATLLPSGKVLVTGGALDGTSPTPAELYDPSTGTWSSTGNTAYSYFGHTATLLPSGKVLVAGSGSSELYDPTTGTWTPTPSRMVSRRVGHTTTLLPSGKVLVAGGSYNNTSLATAEIYDPGSGAWTSTTNMATARHQATSTLLPSGKVLLAGGYNEDELASVEVYDPTTGDWIYTASMLASHANHSAILLSSGKVLVAGVYNNTYTAELYEP
jgi:hypothetical protein